ncbi:hypothetical protein PG993_010064 [Apiospora rasikravindrae]|uniref:RRM domain-containing protein n=1 Tax=Apiospora rasikravindrae TaxID=990691 RepID=A0ABR1SL59_9PEZI
MDAMDLDMEMDVDFVADEPITATQPQDTPSPGEVVDTTTTDEVPESQTLVPNKIHVRGLDVLNPEEVKAYVAEHYPDSRFERIEWIDDSSANLIFPSEAIAQGALVALAAVEIGDVTQLPLLELLPAKGFSRRTEVALQIRLAVASDKKQVGAAQRSRFYLLNPEYDPETRKRYRDRDSERYGRRPRRRSYDDEQREHYSANMYDDDADVPTARSATPQTRHRRSRTPNEDGNRRSYRESNRSKELFPEGTSTRSGSRRDRSASPMRDRDDDLDMHTRSADEAARKNRRGARAIKERLSREDKSKELFPEKTLFSESNRLEDADATSSYLSSRFALPLYDNKDDEPQPRSKRLEDRVTVPSGRLADRITDPTARSGINIRGAANQRGSDQGFAIKGTSKTAKELFPDKFGSNAGKELFSDKLEGRTRRRQKAGDLFD